MRSLTAAVMLSVAAGYFFASIVDGWTPTAIGWLGGVTVLLACYFVNQVIVEVMRVFIDALEETVGQAS